MHRLYDEFGHRYDLHTPPHHYQHDHEFVLALVRPLGLPPRLLDVGCGTGVLLEKAQAAGFHARGLDASAGMVNAARRRLGPEAVTLGRMQALDDPSVWHAVTALSWTLNYCADEGELTDVLARCHAALRPGGLLVAQIAHAPHASGEWYEDREAGPDGRPGDVVLRYRFRRRAGATIEASYAYTCNSAGEAFEEAHHLNVADAHMAVECARAAGFAEVALYESWRRDAFRAAVNPFLVSRKAAG